MMLRNGSQEVGTLSSAPVQAPSGELTTIEASVLSGNTVTKEISGDTNFAQGRWAAGTVTKPDKTYVIPFFRLHNIYDHYVAFTPPTPIPVSGTLTCDAGTFTKPTFNGYGTTGDNFISEPGALGGLVGDISLEGNSRGVMDLTFTATGAKINGGIETNVIETGNTLASTANIVILTTLPTANTVGIINTFWPGRTGAAVALGNDGPSRYLVVVGYTITMGTSIQYVGVATFHCH